MTPVRTAALAAFAIFIAAVAGAGAKQKPVETAAQPDTAQTVADTVLTQHDAAHRFIYTLMTAKADSMALLFTEDLRPHITQEAVEELRSRVDWLYRFIGGDFEQFLSGTGDSAFFREYRLMNEGNSRYPLLLVYLVFADSVNPTIIGADVKTFLGAEETPLAGEQTWKIDDQEVDVQSVLVADVDTGTMLVVRFYDEDTAALTQETVARKAIPLIREAIARGYQDSALVLKGKTIRDGMGVVFVRKDPHRGFMHVKVGFRPEDYSDSAAAAFLKPDTKPGNKPKEKSKKK